MSFKSASESRTSAASLAGRQSAPEIATWRTPYPPLNTPSPLAEAP